MEFVIKTEINKFGHRVFSKIRKGKLLYYIIKGADGKIHHVDKSWVVKNSDDFVNVAFNANNVIIPKSSNWVYSSDISMTYIPSVTSLNRSANLKVVDCYNKWLNEMFISDLEFGLTIKNGEYCFTLYNTKRKNVNEYLDYSLSIVRLAKTVCMKLSLDAYQMLTRVNDLWQGF